MPARTSRWRRSASPSCSASASIGRCARRAGTRRHSAGRPEPDLRQWLDLVALGTVCDVVPLTGVNRALVRQGLLVMAQRRNAGLAALADVARLNETARRLSSGLHAGAAGQCRRPGRAGRSRGAAAVERRSARSRRAGACGSTSSMPSAAPSSARCSTRRSRRIEGLYGPDRKGLPSALRGRERGLACRRDRHRGQPAGRALRPADLRDRHGWRLGQGLGPLGARRRSRRRRDRRPPVRPAGERRRPRHGGRPHRDAKRAARSREIPRRAHRAAARRRARRARTGHRRRPDARAPRRRSWSA